MYWSIQRISRHARGKQLVKHKREEVIVTVYWLTFSYISTGTQCFTTNTAISTSPKTAPNTSSTLLRIWQPCWRNSLMLLLDGLPDISWVARYFICVHIHTKVTKSAILRYDSQDEPTEVILDTLYKLLFMNSCGQMLDFIFICLCISNILCIDINVQ